MAVSFAKPTMRLHGGLDSSLPLQIHASRQWFAGAACSIHHCMIHLPVMPCWLRLSQFCALH
jgi:hypothetical protein